jgi:hypothetical protein
MKRGRFRGYPAPMSPRSVAFSLLLALGAAPLASANDAGMPIPERAPAGGPDLLQRLHAQAPRLDAKVLGLALDAAGCAAESGRVAPARRLAVIDYSKPSTEPRLWVFDLRDARLLYAEHVAHGRRSGENFATAFSNENSSHQTSLGLFATAETYVGGNGYSLRMDGLEPGINDRARDRAIVMHGAPYVDPVMAQRQGRLGRSLGCPAVRPAVAHEVIDTLKGGQLLFAYYPDQQWLASSKFFRCRAGLASRTGASWPAGGR